MRKIMLLAAAAFIGPAGAQAQEAPTARGAMLNSVEWLHTARAEFNATPEQAAQLEAIARKFDAETIKLREDMLKLREASRGSGDRQAVMQKLQPLRDELKKKDDAAVAEAMKLLTEEQQKTAQALIDARRGDMRNRSRPASRVPVQ